MLLDAVVLLEDVRESVGVLSGRPEERFNSRGLCSGDAELELARLSRSSSLVFSFLPVDGQFESIK